MRLPTLAALTAVLPRLPLSAGPADAATRERLVVGLGQFPSNLHPNIDSMAAKSYVLGLTQRPLTTYDQSWSLVCMLCTELPTFENGRRVREPRPTARPAWRSPSRSARTRAGATGRR
jgi:peptide/nickel transport system substrate-binding protein